MEATNSKDADLKDKTIPQHQTKHREHVKCEWDEIVSQCQCQESL